MFIVFFKKSKTNQVFSFEQALLLFQKMFEYYSFHFYSFVYEYEKSWIKFVDWENSFQQYIAGQCTGVDQFIAWYDVVFYSGRWLIVLCFVGCRVTDDSFVQFIEALKENTTLTAIDLSGTFKLFYVFRYY